MFTHLLLPTDGSPPSDDAIHKGIALAKSMQAKVTIVHVIPESAVMTDETRMPHDTRGQLAADIRARAQQILLVARAAADKAGVDCDAITATSDHPHEAIIQTADDRACDLVVMASRGRRGVGGMLVGSETYKVMAHGKTPLLVYR